MWQRIQTLFLVIAIISLLVSIFLPIWVFQDGAGQSHQLYALHYTVKGGENTTTQYFPYGLTAMLAVAAITIAFIEIGKYKNRMLQMKLGALNSLFMAGTIAAAVIFSNQFTKEFQGGVYGLGLWLPGIAVVCNLLANRFIRRDEKIVRDSDRLR
ncbi:MAG TPA: DUF4293 domain-containing protein [Chryseosolibacter sp.]